MRIPLSLPCVIAAACFCHAGELRAQADAQPQTPQTPEPGETAAPSAVSAISKRAIAAMVKRDWATACKEWEAVLKLEPENAAALSNLGKAEFQRRNLEAARTHMEKAVQIRPSLGDTWIALAMVCQEEGHAMLAISHATRAVHEEPGDARLRNGMAIILKRAGWLTAAESELQKALDLQPDYAEPHFNLAVLNMERKPPAVEMARRHYEKALELGAAPDSVIERQLKGEDPAEEEDDGAPADEPVKTEEKAVKPPVTEPADGAKKKSGAGKPAAPPAKKKKSA